LAQTRGFQVLPWRGPGGLGKTAATVDLILRLPPRANRFGPEARSPLVGKSMDTLSLARSSQVIAMNCAPLQI